MVDTEHPAVLHLEAFAEGPGGGNPAGVVLDASGLAEGQMQHLAHQLGYAETAFVTTPLDGARHARLRFFSPDAEVPFCGHATAATAVALAELHGVGAFLFDTNAGAIELVTTESGQGILAAFTSVEPRIAPIDPGVLQRLLGLLLLDAGDLHADYPPMLSFAGNTHPTLVLGSAESFEHFTFNGADMRTLMDDQGWAGTVTILRVLGPAEFEARNLFPVGNILEDPATGSAAASTGAYLRAIGALAPPATITIRQGRHVGRPSILTARIPAVGGITVSGSARRIEGF
ncbi:MAG: PhzF family phenazine biosynthesis protein [Specibacter sp.]